MSTRVAKSQAQSLCDYCHQKPKFGTHGYCSKTCASQAGSGTTNPAMCIQCHQKPKFQGFDFCGKSCAAAAAPQHHNATGTAAANSKGATSNNQQPAINVMKVAQFVAQQVPQVKAILAALNSTSSGAIAQPLPQQQQQQMVPAVQPSAVPQNNPFLQAPAVPAMNGSTPAISSSLLFATQRQTVSAQPADDDTECLIAGCGKPVHVDSKGLKTSDYCSQSHREEAVSSGLVDACIMCLDMPQTQMDYFCSRSCREEAMMKLPE